MSTPSGSSDRLRVGLNLLFLVPGETGGMETYARELVAGLIEHRPDVDTTVFLSREAALDSTGPWTSTRSVVIPVDARKRAARVRGEQWLLPQAATRHGVQLLHSLASTGPATGGFRRIVTVHDLIYRVFPSAHSRAMNAGLRLLVPLAARRSHRVIASSYNTRDDLTRLLGISAERIDVVHLGVRPPAPGRIPDVSEFRHSLGVGNRRVILTLSAKRPHKNISGLLGALALIPPERRPMLLLPGYETAWEPDLRDEARDLGIAADIRLLGWVDDEALEGLFRVADCFVFPSFYEGFGLPVLEAMVRGVPVACSDRASLPEVAGDAALLFDPDEPRSIASAIETLLGDRREAARLIELGRERAATFTWARTARETAACYRRSLGLRA
jgi:glycosyltransferase involved in cell wall biosynthesis